ncbi:MAG TPA: hypothetical protein VFH68_18605 [Polyangia bacterium]|nr:hypothetical protein [Polyangia bacterium]
MPADEDLDQLLAAPLPTFIEERRRLTDALKAAGRRDDAKAIAKINKPSVPVWVVNQLARSEGSLLTRLGVLTDELRDMPAAGSAAAAGYAQLVTEHREVLRSLRAAAERILIAADHDAGPALLERIVHSLRAGMADAQTRAAIERGRLLREIGEVDFTSMVGAAAGPSASPGTAPAERAPPHPRAPARAHRSEAADVGPAAQERARERAALQAERERTRARAAAERELERARNQATAAGRRAVEEQRALESARRVLEAANRAVEAARRTLEEKEERAASAHREEEIAARAVESAEAAARALADH